MRCLLSSALIIINLIHTVSCSNESSSRIRGGIPTTKNGSPKGGFRTHPVRRIYGPDNASVRSEVHKIETDSNQYWRTGIRSDPTFEVPYESHPLDPKRRRLQDESTGSSESLMKPMRIKWDSTALDTMKDGNNDAKIDFIKSQILPKMTQFWSDTLSVVPVSGNLKIQSGELVAGYCGDSEFSLVPEEHTFKGVSNTDLLLYISGTPSSRFCGPTTLAVAVACNWDQYDRPTAGAINFCIDQVNLDSDGNADPWVVDDNVDVAVHEAGHVLGMSSNSYRFFWNPETGKPRTARPIKPKTVKCVDGNTKTTYVPDENTLQFIENDAGTLAAVIVTEKVRTVARNQFNCQDLEGAQLEVR